MHVRPAQLSDMDLVYGLDHSYQTDQVWQLSNKSSLTEYSAIMRLAKLPRPIQVQYPHDEAMLRRTLHRADFLWVMQGEGIRDILGYLALTLLPWQNTACITSLAVAPAARRKKVATQLLRAANEQARGEGMHSVTGDVPTKNHPATRLYQSCGFKFTGYAENYYSAHDIALLFASKIR